MILCDANDVLVAFHSYAILLLGASGDRTGFVERERLIIIGDAIRKVRPIKIVGDLRRRMAACNLDRVCDDHQSSIGLSRRI